MAEPEEQHREDERGLPHGQQSVSHDQLSSKLTNVFRRQMVAWIALVLTIALSMFLLRNDRATEARISAARTALLCQVIDANRATMAEVTDALSAPRLDPDDYEGDLARLLREDQRVREAQRQRALNALEAMEVPGITEACREAREEAGPARQPDQAP